MMLSTYHEHNENQVLQILKQKKKKRLKRKIKIVFVVLFGLLLIGLLRSPLLKVKEVSIQGLQNMNQEDIREHISINDSYYILLNKANIEAKIKELPQVKDVNVKCDIFGYIIIEVKEAQAIAYATIDDQTYEINDAGNILFTKDQNRINELKTLPVVRNFQDTDMLIKFAEAYKDVSSLNRNYISDVMLKPLPADETLLECLLVDDYIIYIRIEDLSYWLKGHAFDFEAQKTKYPDQKILSFEGKYMYMLKERK